MVQWLTNLFSPKQSTKKREKVRKSRRRKSKRKKSRRKSRRRKSRRKSRKRKSMRKSRKRKSMRKSKRRKSMRKSRKRKSKRRKSMRKSRKRKSMRKSTTGLSSFQRNLQQKIKTSPWFICTMKGCGYCNEAKKILKSHHQKYRSIALTDKTLKNMGCNR